MYKILMAGLIVVMTLTVVLFSSTVHAETASSPCIYLQGKKVCDDGSGSHATRPAPTQKPGYTPPVVQYAPVWTYMPRCRFGMAYTPWGWQCAAPPVMIVVPYGHHRW